MSDALGSQPWITLDDITGDLARLIGALVVPHVDGSNPLLHGDELRAECWAKLAKILDGGHPSDTTGLPHAKRQLVSPQNVHNHFRLQRQSQFPTLLSLAFVEGLPVSNFIVMARSRSSTIFIRNIEFSVSDFIVIPQFV